jgi:hypothetical protein
MPLPHPDYIQYVAACVRWGVMRVDDVNVECYSPHGLVCMTQCVYRCCLPCYARAKLQRTFSLLLPNSLPCYPC